MAGRRRGKELRPLPRSLLVGERDGVERWFAREDDGVGDDDLDREMALALWVLGELPPELVPGLAVRALERGCEAPSVAVLAGMQRSTTRDVEDVLAGVLSESRATRPAPAAALKVVVDDCARRIVAGAVAV